MDLLARRRALGQDHFDEVWNGEHHMNAVPDSPHGRARWRLAVILDPMIRAAGLHPVAEFNLGPPDVFRVPDLGALRHPPTETWLDDAALVIEVLSPHDESWEKLDHDATFGVTEIWMVDPFEGWVQIFHREPGATDFERTDHSVLLDVDAASVAASLATD